MKEQTKFVSLTEQVGVEANIQDDYGSDIINRLQPLNRSYWV